MTLGPVQYEQTQKVSLQGSKTIQCTKNTYLLSTLQK